MKTQLRPLSPINMITSRMLDHFGLLVPASSFCSILSFYESASAPLGYKRNSSVPDQSVDYAAYGTQFDFWILKKDEKARLSVHFAS